MMTSHDFPSQGGVPGFWWEQDYRRPEFMREVLPPDQWDDRLLAHIDEHLVMETNVSAEYESYAEMGDAQIRYLAGLIAAAEHRHHSTLSGIAASVRATAGGEGEAPEWGQSGPLAADQRETVLKETKRLLQIEQDDAEKLKQIREDLRSAPRGAMWPVLVEIMAIDTEKHVKVLQAIEQRLEQ